LKFYRSLQHEYADAKLPDAAGLFVARDLIFHGHLYLVTGQYAPESALVDAQHLQGGDGKFRAVVDPLSRTTRSLGLNVVPSLITRRDVAKYLRAMITCFSALVAAGFLKADPLSDVEIFGEKGDRAKARRRRSVARSVRRPDGLNLRGILRSGHLSTSSMRVSN
jgi:hypothetical protein